MSSLCKLLVSSGSFCYSLAYHPRTPCHLKFSLQHQSFHRVSCRNAVKVTSAHNHNNDDLPEDTSRTWTSTIGETIKESNHARHLHIVLFQPQIAGNTGCIARTCAATSVDLHLIEPLGFQIDDAKLKRAGLDYWPFVFVKVHASWSDFMNYFKQQDGEKRLVAFTKRGTCLHTDKEYKSGDWLVFGSETTGLSAEALEDCGDETNYGGGKVRIPMLDTYVRCLNLSVSVGIGVYEALRQLNVLRNLYNETHDHVPEDFSEVTSGKIIESKQQLLSAVSNS